MQTTLQKAARMQAAAKKLVDSYAIGTPGRTAAERFERDLSGLSDDEAARMFDIIKSN